MEKKRTRKQRHHNKRNKKGGANMIESLKGIMDNIGTCFKDDATMPKQTQQETKLTEAQTQAQAKEQSQAQAQAKEQGTNEEMKTNAELKEAEMKEPVKAEAKIDTTPKTQTQMDMEKIKEVAEQKEKSIVQLDSYIDNYFVGKSDCSRDNIENIAKDTSNGDVELEKKIDDFLTYLCDKSVQTGGVKILTNLFKTPSKNTKTPQQEQRELEYLQNTYRDIWNKITKNQPNLKDTLLEKYSNESGSSFEIKKFVLNNEILKMIDLFVDESGNNETRKNLCIGKFQENEPEGEGNYLKYQLNLLLKNYNSKFYDNKTVKENIKNFIKILCITPQDDRMTNAIGDLKNNYTFLWNYLKDAQTFQKREILQLLDQYNKFKKSNVFFSSIRDDIISKLNKKLEEYKLTDTPIDEIDDFIENPDLLCENMNLDYLDDTIQSYVKLKYPISEEEKISEEDQNEIINNYENQTKYFLDLLCQFYKNYKRYKKKEIMNLDVDDWLKFFQKKYTELWETMDIKLMKQEGVGEKMKKNQKLLKNYEEFKKSSSLFSQIRNEVINILNYQFKIGSLNFNFTKTPIDIIDSIIEQPKLKCSNINFLKQVSYYYCYNESYDNVVTQFCDVLCNLFNKYTNINETKLENEEEEQLQNIYLFLWDITKPFGNIENENFTNIESVLKLLKIYKVFQENNKNRLFFNIRKKVILQFEQVIKLNDLVNKLTNSQDKPAREQIYKKINEIIDENGDNQIKERFINKIRENIDSGKIKQDYQEYVRDRLIRVTEVFKSNNIFIQNYNNLIKYFFGEKQNPKFEKLDDTKCKEKLVKYRASRLLNIENIIQDNLKKFKEQENEKINDIRKKVLDELLKKQLVDDDKKTSEEQISKGVDEKEIKKEEEIKMTEQEKAAIVMKEEEKKRVEEEKVRNEEKKKREEEEKQSKRDDLYNAALMTGGSGKRKTKKRGIRKNKTKRHHKRLKHKTKRRRTGQKMNYLKFVR